ncbi:hypothetical protein P6B95_19710 [Streptomyces atratus]|uniref:hypothetical protein n=1 Tax=Streptomyces atratus TaxID=1893 RepID=UPI002AC359C0|nr:hypothetical protein [Streptomyces atratus]WPW33779.1 hypothetical protein P6B95_19710 [Streptomyces atratus]
MPDLHKEVSEPEQKSATAPRLFDIRRITGGLFVIHGGGSSPDRDSASYVRQTHRSAWTVALKP